MFYNRESKYKGLLSNELRPFIGSKSVTGKSIDDAQWWFLDTRQNVETGNSRKRRKITENLPDA
jgi:hypothetical protein